MSAAPEDLLHRIDDMGTVTFLRYQGHTPQDQEWVENSRGGTCYWYFRTTEKFLRDLDLYNEGSALVEPHRYNKLFLATKHEFYDANPNDQGRRGRRST